MSEEPKILSRWTCKGGEKYRVSQIARQIGCDQRTMIGMQSAECRYSDNTLLWFRFPAEFDKIFTPEWK